VKKLKQNWIEPIDYLLNKPQQHSREFVSSFVRATSGDEDALFRVGMIAKVAYDAAKDPRNNATPDEIATTNTYTWLFNQLAKDVLSEREPVAEPPATPTTQHEGAK
jgi:hypothetical protein